MANCITLTNILTQQAEKFAIIDDKMRQHFNAEPDSQNWFQNWYNTIAFSLALGHTWQQVKSDWPEKLAVINWLEQNYIPDAWYSR